VLGRRRPRSGSDPLTAAAVAGSVVMTAASIAVAALGMPGLDPERPAARAVGEVPARVVVLSDRERAPARVPDAGARS
jgi:hypothetical protein